MVDDWRIEPKIACTSPVDFYLERIPKILGEPVPVRATQK